MELATLNQLSAADLAILAQAIDTAGEAWMIALVQEALTKPEPSLEPIWTKKP
jgi:hypothetical protein